MSILVIWLIEDYKVHYVRRAVINRYGFNSQGVEKVKENITAARNSLEGKKLGLVGINLGKNKTSEDAVGDYCTGVRELGYLADYLVINISSPNTPGLRALQSRKELETLISAVLQERNSLQITEKVCVYVSLIPDYNDAMKYFIISQGILSMTLSKQICLLLVVQQMK